MTEKKKLDLSNQIILNKLEEKAFAYLSRQLGELKAGNRESYHNQQKEAATLAYNKKEYLIPKGCYMLTDQEACVNGVVDSKDMLAQLIVAIYCEEYKSESITEGLLMHLLQVSYLNAVRDYIKETLFPSLYKYYFKEAPNFVSSYYGPGLFEQPFETMKSMYDAAEAEKIGLMMKGNRLYPNSSFIGSLYMTRQPIKEELPCNTCKAHTGCEYCMIRQAGDMGGKAR